MQIYIAIPCKNRNFLEITCRSNEFLWKWRRFKKKYICHTEVIFKYNFAWESSGYVSFFNIKNCCGYQILWPRFYYNYWRVIGRSEAVLVNCAEHKYGVEWNSWVLDPERSTMGEFWDSEGKAKRGSTVRVVRILLYVVRWMTGEIRI